MSELPKVLWLIFAGVLGLTVGSFLNVVILRLPPRMQAQWQRDARDLLALPQEPADVLPPGIVREPSHCPHCRHPLKIRDNLPVISWLLLHGRCRDCAKPISTQYPLVELLGAAIGVLMVWNFGPTPSALAGLLFGWALIALAGIDLRTQLLPDTITLPLLWLGLLLSLSPLFVPPGQAILGAAIGYLSLWSVYWLFKLLTGKEGMGHGDFKLLAAMGAWMGAPALLPIILLSSLSGLLVGGILIATGRHRRGAPMPFGPFIAGAGLLWFVCGDRLLAVYLAGMGLR